MCKVTPKYIADMPKAPRTMAAHSHLGIVTDDTVGDDVADGDAGNDDVVDDDVAGVNKVDSVVADEFVHQRGNIWLGDGEVGHVSPGDIAATMTIKSDATAIPTAKNHRTRTCFNKTGSQALLDLRLRVASFRAVFPFSAALLLSLLAFCSKSSRLTRSEEGNINMPSATAPKEMSTS